MKNIWKLSLVTFLMVMLSGTINAQSSKYKVMIQMDNYSGKNAYVVVSLINPNGQYEKTLSVLGDDNEWYNTLKEWHKFAKVKKEKLNGITGASIGGGARAMKVLEFDNAKINKGYKIRFESAVENQKYITKDAELDLSSAVLDSKAVKPGSVYIKAIRFIKM